MIGARRLTVGKGVDILGVLLLSELAHVEGSTISVNIIEHMSVLITS